MNLSLLAMQALCFLQEFALAAVLGTGCYWMFRSKFLVVRGLAVLAVVGFFEAYVTSIARILSHLANWPVLLIQPGLMVLVSFAQAFLERVLSRPRASWWRVFGVCLATNICLLCAGQYYLRSILTSLYSVFGTSLLFGVTPLQSQGLGYFLGILLTPPSISFFRWVLPNLKLRPGLDREFEDGEFAR